MQRYIFILVCVLLLLPFQKAMGEVSVALNLDRTDVTIAESVRMVVSVKGARSMDSSPSIQGLEPFTVSPRGSSTRMEIINGKFGSGTDYTYDIQAKAQGTFTLGPARVRVKGKTYESNTRTLTVVKEAASKGEVQKPLFLNASLSSKKAYMEEQVFYTLKLHLSVQASDISLELPKVDHLGFKQLGGPIEYQQTQKGRRYQVLEVRYALVASKQGTYGIPPAKMQLTVYQSRRGPSRGFFDDPFFRSGRSVVLSSEPLQLEVVPLPEAGRPKDFSGLVGDFKIQSTLVPEEIKAGESATLTVNVTGRGNINRMPDLKSPVLSDGKVYADEPVLKTGSDSSGLIGSKTMKWALVPGKEGVYDIPGMEVSFFDPKAQKYQTAKTPSHLLRVLPGQREELAAGVDSGRKESEKAPEKLAVEELGRDILPVHTSVAEMKGLRVASGGLFWVVLLVPLVGYWAVHLGLGLQKRSIATMRVSKAKKAAKSFLKRCREGALDANGLSLAIRDYLNDRFGLSMAAVTPEDIAQILRKRGISPENAIGLQRIMKELEDAIYTGRNTQPDHLIQQVSLLIPAIEKEIR